MTIARPVRSRRREQAGGKAAGWSEFLFHPR
jgi:hypothetical protein